MCLVGNASDCTVETNASTALTASLFETVWNSSSLDYTTSHVALRSFCSTALLQIGGDFEVTPLLARNASLARSRDDTTKSRFGPFGCCAVRTGGWSDRTAGPRLDFVSLREVVALIASSHPEFCSVVRGCEYFGARVHCPTCLQRFLDRLKRRLGRRRCELP